MPRPQADPSIRWSSKRGRDPAASLWSAVAHGDSKTAELLLASGVDPDRTDPRAGVPAGSKHPPRDGSPALLAAKLGHPGILRALLDAGADPAALGPDGGGLLLRAAQARCPRSLAIAKKACEGGPTPAPDRAGATLLMACSLWGAREALDTALGFPFDPAAADAAAATALHMACAMGHGPAAERLIALGAPIDPRDLAGRSPLSLAAAIGWIPMMRRLAALGADVDAMDSDGLTILMRLCRKPRREPLQEMLTLGADPRLAQGGDPNRPTAAGICIQAGWPWHLRDLIHAGADPDKAWAGETPYALALRCKRWWHMEDFVRELGAAGADVERVDAGGMPALGRAFEPRQVKALAGAGADFNFIVAWTGQAYLEHCCLFDRQPRISGEVAEALLEGGALITPKVAALLLDPAWIAKAKACVFDCVEKMRSAELRQRELRQLSAHARPASSAANAPRL